MCAVFKLSRCAICHDAVGVIVRHQLAIGDPDRVEICRVRDPQNFIGIIRLRAQMAGLDATKVCIGKSEDGRDPLQIEHLIQRHDAIRASDIEQSVQHAFEQAGPITVAPRNPRGIAFIAAHRLACDVEDPADRCGILGRSAENLRENSDLTVCDFAIGFRKLGPQSDNSRCKPDIMWRWRTHFAAFPLGQIII